MARRDNDFEKSGRPSGRGNNVFRNDFGGRSFHDWDDQKNQAELPKIKKIKK